MRQVDLPDGSRVAALGQGTWKMGEGGDPAAEIAALRLGLDLGMTLIDTAEMYADGGAETVVGQAIAGRRDTVYLVGKIMPQNTGRKGAGIAQACERSLRRLRTDRIDLYLLHWPGAIGHGDLVAAFEALRDTGKIGAWGVSNFDTADMAALIDAGGTGCATDQVLYNPQNRGIEFDLLPWCRAHAMPVTAYSPVGQGGALLRHPALRQVAQAHGATSAQVAIAWTLRQPGVISIPKSSDLAHVRDNAAATSIVLTPDDLAVIDAAFPPPRRKVALEML